jgi:hypothetical protein
MDPQRQDVMGNNHTTGSIIYICTVTCESCSRHRRPRRKDCVYFTGWRLISFHVPSIRSGRKFSEVSLNPYYLGAQSRFGVGGPWSRYACLLKSDTANRLTVRKNQPSWDLECSSPMTRLRHASTLTLSSPSTQPSRGAEGCSITAKVRDRDGN